jgi:hypothetical protein
MGETAASPTRVVVVTVRAVAGQPAVDADGVEDRRPDLVGAGVLALSPPPQRRRRKPSLLGVVDECDRARQRLASRETSDRRPDYPFSPGRSRLSLP